MIRLIFRTKRFFTTEKKGAAAVEFALIVPILIVLYLGVVELSLALSLERKVVLTTSAIADLVAQADEVDLGELQDIVAASSAILAPFDAARMAARISSVTMQVNGKIEVGWSDGFNLQPLSVGEAVTLPDGLLSPSQSVIMVEVIYDYDSPIGRIRGASYQMQETYYIRPRRTEAVSRR